MESRDDCGDLGGREGPRELLCHGERRVRWRRGGRRKVKWSRAEGEECNPADTECKFFVGTSWRRVQLKREWNSFQKGLGTKGSRSRSGVPSLA